MKNYSAKIVAGKVDEIIVADINWAQENLIGEWVDCTPEDGDLVVGCGWSYDSETNTFAPPLPVE
jgi:hypothetical protein